MQRHARPADHLVLVHVQNLSRFICLCQSDGQYLDRQLDVAFLNHQGCQQMPDPGTLWHRNVRRISCKCFPVWYQGHSFGAYHKQNIVK